MTNYNDGNWHGWNGGECPVHPESIVETCWVSDESVGSITSYAYDILWSKKDGVSTIAFRVVKEYREPRDFWVNPASLEAATSAVSGYIRMREVIE